MIVFSGWEGSHNRRSGMTLVMHYRLCHIFVGVRTLTNLLLEYGNLYLYYCIYCIPVYVCVPFISRISRA